MKTKIHQGIHVFRGDQVNATAIAAITTVRPPQRNVFFPPETYAAVSAIASFNANFNFINEFHSNHSEN
jgi:hypothetical protein